MKKLFTLLFALGTITAVSAQSSHRESDSRNVVLQKAPVYDDRNDHSFGSNDRNSSNFGRDQEIDRINRFYDSKIQSVQWNRRMRQSEKNREIRSLQQQKSQALRDVQDKYSRNAHYGQTSSHSGRY
jgi:hypothetical protein